MLIKLFVFGISLVLFSFMQSCIKPIGADPFPNDGKIPDDLEITLTRTGCHGTCPSYSLTIDTSGNIVFDGKMFTGTIGKAKDKIDQKVIPELLKEFEKAQFFDLNDRYEIENDGCGSVSTDNPSEIISIKLNGKTKSVNHYFGCEEVPGDALERITNLGKKIDESVNSKRWIEGWKYDDVYDK